MTRLTGYRSQADRIRRLLLESLLFLEVLGEDAAPLVDVGSGAGVPGLVLKLARPGWTIVLVEATRRRISFLRHIVRILELEGVEVAPGRAEAIVQEPGRAGHFSTAVMRAVAEPARAWRLARGFLRPGGRLVLLLGSAAAVTGGTVREIAVPGSGSTLPWHRRFLILAEEPGAVPRGT